MAELETTVRERANDSCELCSETGVLELYELSPPREGPGGVVLLCEPCRAQLSADVDIDPEHFRYCLQGTIWSEVPAVQVLTWRLLQLIDTSWSREILDGAYLSDDVLEWAKEGLEVEPDDDRPPAFDSNGAQLADGDAVTLIKDLDVKGANFTAKRGTLVKGIRLTQDPDLIEGKVNKIAIMLRTEFLKKA